MKKWWSWWVLGCGLAALLAGTALVALRSWLGSDDFRLRVQSAATAAMGAPLTLGRISLDVWPMPAVALDGVRIQTTPPVGIERVEARLVLGALWSGRLELATLLVRRAEVAQLAWEDLQARRKKGGPSGAGDMAASLPHRVVLDAMTWRPVDGAATTVDADAVLARDGFPDTLSLKVVTGPLQGADLRLARKLLVWEVLLNYAGGKVVGEMALDKLPVAGVEWSATGRLVSTGVELGGLSQRRLTGQTDATTTLSLRSAHAGTLWDSLQTQSQFTVRQAVLHGADLARAVKTTGLSRGGETRLDTLAGEVSTSGRKVSFSHLVARSGILSASGNVAISPSRGLSGRIRVNLGPAAVGELVGVPLILGGTLHAPELTLTRAAMLGAAVGTLVMPGVGTGAGAALGDKMGDKFKGLFGK